MIDISPLFKPLYIRGLELKNRIVMAPRIAVDRARLQDTEWVVKVEHHRFNELYD